MVNFNNISEYSKSSQSKGGSEKIAGGPLYDLARVKLIAKDGSGLVLWTRDCVRDVRELGWDTDDVAALMSRLTVAHYIDSEWCANGRGAWAACDAYCVGALEWVPTARKELRIEYFVKFAISQLGSLVLTVSCHT
jgi:hypothetical protein